VRTGRKSTYTVFTEAVLFVCPHLEQGTVSGVLAIGTESLRRAMVSSRPSLFGVTAVESSARLPRQGVCDKSAEKDNDHEKKRG
jgi:hypothetical protein